MKQIVLIADSDPRKKVIGGIGIYALNLSKYLDSNGYEIIFIGKKQEGELITTFKHLRFIEATKKDKSTNIEFLVGIFNISKTLKLSESAVIHSQRPDWLIPFALFKNKKIITMHGSHRKNVFLKKGFIFGSIYSILEKKGLMAADKIISVSDDTTTYYTKIYGKKIGDKIVTIPVGIDTSRFIGLDKSKARKKYGFDMKDKVVLNVGRLEKEKNLKPLIAACSKIDAKLFIVGNGREEQELKDYAAKIKCKARFIDFVSNEDIPEIMACGDVFGLTSLYEGLPTAIIEAMACGVPVVSYDVGDVKKVVIDGKTGYLADENTLSDKLRELIEKSKSFRINCMKKAKEFSIEKIGSKLSEVYER
jgi:glycosyltransferase involved in cell wall biosynthesis